MIQNHKDMILRSTPTSNKQTNNTQIISLSEIVAVERIILQCVNIAHTCNSY